MFGTVFLHIRSELFRWDGIVMTALPFGIVEGFCFDEVNKLFCFNNTNSFTQDIHAVIYQCNVVIYLHPSVLLD